VCVCGVLVIWIYLDHKHLNEQGQKDAERLSRYSDREVESRLEGGGGE
jgi:hypothetical protein